MGYLFESQHMMVILDMRQNHDIMITRPGRGNGIVILTRADHIGKMLSILGDGMRFVKIGDVSSNESTNQQE